MIILVEMRNILYSIKNNSIGIIVIFFYLQFLVASNNNAIVGSYYSFIL